MRIILKWICSLWLFAVATNTCLAQDSSYTNQEARFGIPMRLALQVASVEHYAKRVEGLPDQNTSGSRSRMYALYDTLNWSDSVLVRLFRRGQYTVLRFTPRKYAQICYKPYAEIAYVLSPSGDSLRELSLSWNAQGCFSSYTEEYAQLTLKNLPLSLSWDKRMSLRIEGEQIAQGKFSFWYHFEDYFSSYTATAGSIVDSQSNLLELYMTPTDPALDVAGHAPAPLGITVEYNYEGVVLRLPRAHSNTFEVVQIFDALGREVYRSTCLEGQLWIPRELLPSGLYFAISGGLKSKLLSN